MFIYTLTVPSMQADFSHIHPLATNICQCPSFLSTLSPTTVPLWTPKIYLTARLYGAIGPYTTMNKILWSYTLNKDLSTTNRAFLRVTGQLRDPRTAGTLPFTIPGLGHCTSYRPTWVTRLYEPGGTSSTKRTKSVKAAMCRIMSGRQHRRLMRMKKVAVCFLSLSK